jgi:hypothetical protein
VPIIIVVIGASWWPVEFGQEKNFGAVQCQEAEFILNKVALK